MNRRVLIVGGGVIGLSTAYYCRLRGCEVTVLDRAASEEDGCSFGNAGMIVPSHFVPLAAPGMVGLALRWMWNPESPFYIQPRLDLGLLSWGLKFYRSATAAHVARSAPLLRDLHLLSRECFEELAERGADFGLVKKGLLMLCKEKHVFEEEARVAERARELGIPAERLRVEELAKLEPNIRMDVVGAIYYPKDCHLSPSHFLRALRKSLEEMAVDLKWNREVIGWRTDGHHIRTVRTSGREWEGDEFVVCGGAWSAGVVRDLRLNLPLQAGKGYSVTLPQPRALPQICAILTEARVAITPMNGALRVGGTMEMSGINREIRPARVQGIVKAVPRYYPDLRREDFDGLTAWCGLRPCSPDGLPYLGRTGRYANLSIATGHAMMGLSLGPITGKLMAKVLAGEPPGLNLGLLHPDRYG
jgi:D-amino-acid dehydrogenase